MDVAIGSALLLTALGEQVYAELLGHHLMQGFGAAQRVDLAEDWYQLGISSDRGRPAAGVRAGPARADRADQARRCSGSCPIRTPVVPAATSSAPDQVKNKLTGFAINK